MNRFIQNKCVFTSDFIADNSPPSAPRNIPAVVMAENVAVVELSVQPSSFNCARINPPTALLQQTSNPKATIAKSTCANGSQVACPAWRRSAVLLFVPCDNVLLINMLFIKVVSHDDFNRGFIDHGVKPFAPLRQADTVSDHRFNVDCAAGQQAYSIAPDVES